MKQCHNSCVEVTSPDMTISNVSLWAAFIAAAGQTAINKWSTIRWRQRDEGVQRTEKYSGTVHLYCRQWHWWSC